MSAPLPILPAPTDIPVLEPHKVVVVVTIARSYTILVLTVEELRALEQKHELRYPLTDYLNNATARDLERKLMTDYTVSHCEEKACELTEKAMKAISKLRDHATDYLEDSAYPFEIQSNYQVVEIVPTFVDV